MCWNLSLSCICITKRYVRFEEINRDSYSMMLNMRMNAHDVCLFTMICFVCIYEIHC